MREESRKRYVNRPEELKILAERLKNGDESAFVPLYQKTYQFVYSRARFTVHDDDEAQDLMQEVYIAAYKNMRSLKDSAKVLSWLAAITYRQGIKLLNKKKRNVLLREDQEEIFEEIPDEEKGAEERMAREEEVRLIEGFIRDLPEEQRTVVLAYYYDEMKISDIARMLDLSGDGTPELLISQYIETLPCDYHIVDMYGYADGEVQKFVFQAGTESRKEEAVQEKTVYTVCENNMLRYKGTGSPQNYGIEYYQMEEDTTRLTLAEGAWKTGETFERYGSDRSAAGESGQEGYLSGGAVSQDIPGLARQYYGGFLEYYKQEEEGGFSRNDLELINPIFWGKSYFPDGYPASGMELYYTVADLGDRIRCEICENRYQMV